MEGINFWFFVWMIAGLINIGLLYLVQLLRPESLFDKLNYGFLHQVGVLVLWFVFGFIIIPFLVVNTLRKWVGRKLMVLFFILVGWYTKRKLKKVFK